MRLPSLSPSMITRHGEPAPFAPMAARAISDWSSSRRDTRACTPGLPSPRPRQIQAAVVAQVRLADGERVLSRAAHQRQVVGVVLANAARLDGIELALVAGIHAADVEARAVVVGAERELGVFAISRSASSMPASAGTT